EARNAVKLFKIRPVLDALEKTFDSAVNPEEFQWIDEQVIPFKGRLSLKQYIPKKPNAGSTKICARGGPSATPPLNRAKHQSIKDILELMSKFRPSKVRTNCSFHSLQLKTRQEIELTLIEKTKRPKEDSKPTLTSRHLSTMGSSSSFPSPSPSDPQHEEWATLPPRFVDLQCLGEGKYGKVIKCMDQETKKVVAVKTPRYGNDLTNEASTMKLLMDHNLDQDNIVKYHEELSTDQHLVFEELDIDFLKYLMERDSPMQLEDIRVVIQQLATALDSLKSVGLIHTDLKPNNIMFVDHVKKPFQVKVIDFGMAVLTSEAPQMINQTPCFKAPEIIMGLPYSEAVDVWSLGCIMATMVFGFQLFPGRLDYETLSYIIDLIGPPPPEHLIDTARKARVYFKKTESNRWEFRTRRECWEAMYDTPDKRSYQFWNLDATKNMRLEEENAAEAEERDQCIELLKAMLTWDQKERITPKDILAHPFITRLAAAASVRPLSVLTLVQPASPRNRHPLEEESDHESDDGGDTPAPKGAEADCSLTAETNQDTREDNARDNARDDTQNNMENDIGNVTSDSKVNDKENNITSVDKENDKENIITSVDKENDKENNITSVDKVKRQRKQHHINDVENNTEKETDVDTDVDSDIEKDDVKVDDTDDDTDYVISVDTGEDADDEADDDTDDEADDDTDYDISIVVSVDSGEDADDEADDDTSDEADDDTDDEADDDTSDEADDDPDVGVEDDTLGCSENHTQQSEPKKKKKKKNCGDDASSLGAVKRCSPAAVWTTWPSDVPPNPRPH
ncbi:hypothetical protein L3Q82_008435, partial [Scortum barcoo]